MYAIGSNERATALSGTNTNFYKVLAYVISGVTASIGGLLLAARLGRGDIASGNNLLLDSVAAALIGFAVLGAAKPNALGTAIGALFVGILLQGLTMMNAPYYTQDFVKGGVLVIALVFTFALTSRSLYRFFITFPRSLIGSKSIVFSFSLISIILFRSILFFFK